MRRLAAALLSAVLLSGVTGGTALAAPRAADLVHADLIAQREAVQAGRPFMVGVRLRMAEHWHTYWLNPGDSGLPTEVKLDLPAGFSAGPIEWPVPERIPVADMMNYGYEGEATLLMRVTPPVDLAAGATVPIQAHVHYLVCERECIPGEADLALSLPSAPKGASVEADAATRDIFAAARAHRPRPAPGPAHYTVSGDTLTLALDAPGLATETIRSAYFFPYDDSLIDQAAPQSFAARSGGLSLTLKRSPSAKGETGAPAGVLVVGEGGSQGVFALGDEPNPAGNGTAADAVGVAPTSAAAPAVAASLGEFAPAILFAFLGGLILNLMPCVFPVLSIKLLGLVGQSGRSRGAVRLNGLAYAVGVVASFLALAGALLAIRAGGAQIGWGFQLQSPTFVAGLAFLLFAMGLGLSGVVELGASFGSLGGRLATRPGLAGSFFAGVLASVVATPCTAPFMGSAVGYALAAPNLIALSVFGALGLGLAAPFLVLTLAPGLVRLLPRPGAWMEILKQVLAFPIYATVAWLIFVLAQEVGPSGLFAALIGLVLVAFCLWALRLAAFREGRARRAGQGVAILAAAAILAIGIVISRDDGIGGSAVQSAAAGGVEPYTQARLDALRADGRPAFVDLTAAWCITCLVNERTTLGAPSVQAAMKDHRVAYLRGDWTNRNAEITRLLDRHGRSGVPLYLLYPARGEAVVLPQILTPSLMLDRLAGLDTPDKRRVELTPPARP